MRPTEDLAYRARNWFWYWRVRAISGLSNDRLDQKCFGDQRRRRHFERLQATASAPNEVALVEGQTLLAIVDGWDRPDDGGPGPFASATQAFNSRLWTFLATRDHEPVVYSDFIRSFAEERGWRRAHMGDRLAYETFLGSNEPAIEEGVSTAYSAMLHQLVNYVNPEATAALIALFREAMHQGHLEHAIAIRTALHTSVLWMCKQLGVPEDSRMLILKLVKDRVFANRWVTEADWRNHTKAPPMPEKTSRVRSREFQAWVSWYISRPKSFDFTGYGPLPLVPRSARTDWLENRLETDRDHLDQVRLEINQLRKTHHKFSTSRRPKLQRIATEARLRAEELLSQFCPPDREPAQFYITHEPYIEMESLPRSYPDKTATSSRSTVLGMIGSSESPSCLRRGKGALNSLDSMPSIPPHEGRNGITQMLPAALPSEIRGDATTCKPGAHLSKGHCDSCHRSPVTLHASDKESSAAYPS